MQQFPMLLGRALSRIRPNAVGFKHNVFLAQRPGAFSRSTMHRSLTHSAPLYTNPNPKPSLSKPSPNQSQPENPSLPSFNLWAHIREAKPAVRYTVYAGLGLMATVESTFWFNVIRAKFFGGEEDRKRADEMMERVREAMRGYRHVWMRNYGRYYGAHLWGVGYGGLDGLEDAD